jgi:integrase
MPRIYGPYAHRRGWKVVVLDEEHHRSSHVCASYEEAHDLIRALDTDLGADPGVRIGTAIDRYGAFMAYKGNKVTSIATTKYRLQAFFAEVIWEPLRRLDRGTCQQLYDRLVATQAVDTHRNTLSQAKSFLAWCVHNHYLALNPIDRVRPVGKRQHGKPQLRLDEARAWLSVAKHLATADQRGAIAAMMALLMGMRSSEILRCAARDVDDGARLLWIPLSKTRSGRRVLEIPPVLRRHLARLSRGQPSLARLFPYRREWLYKWVRRICDDAGTPLVCTHSMRGLHATIAIDAGITPPAVATALGHASVRATLLSYADPNTVARARQRRVVAALGRRTTRREPDAGKSSGKNQTASSARPPAAPQI